MDKSLETTGFKIIRGLVEKQVRSQLLAFARLAGDGGDFATGDFLVPTAPSAYCHPATERLLDALLSRVEAETQLSLYPTYDNLLGYQRRIHSGILGVNQTPCAFHSVSTEPPAASHHCEARDFSMPTSTCVTDPRTVNTRIR